MPASSSSEVLWPPTPSSSTAVADPNSHLGFSVPQHLHPEDASTLEAYSHEKLELPWWGYVTDQTSLLAAGSTANNRRSPFLYAPPAAAAQSGPGLMSGVVPHFSLFDPSESEDMDTWFSALKGNSLMGTVAQLHEREAQDHLMSDTESSEVASKTERNRASAKATRNGPNLYSDRETEEPPSSGGPRKRRKRPQAAKTERVSSEEAAPATKSASPPESTFAVATTPSSLQPEAAAKQQQPRHTTIDSRKSKQPLSSQQKRQNHIESEKRRRETIKAAFGALVETLRSANALGDDDQAQGRPRGRGRKGEGTGGATKNVVLAKAVEHVKVLQQGNEALRKELAQLEATAVS